MAVKVSHSRTRLNKIQLFFILIPINWIAHNKWLQVQIGKTICSLEIYLFTEPPPKKKKPPKNKKQNKTKKPSFIPSSSLINSLGNEVSRESVLKVLLAGEGVVALGIRHAARLEPAVKDLWHTTQDPFAPLWWDGQVINAETSNNVNVMSRRHNIFKEETLLLGTYEKKV